METSTPLRLTEIATLVIVTYGFGSPQSKLHVEKMIQALEAAGLTWTHICSDHEDISAHCKACQNSGWHLQAPTIPDNKLPLNMIHIEKYIDHVKETEFVHENDLYHVETAIKLLEYQIEDERPISKKTQTTILNALKAAEKHIKSHAIAD